MREMSIVDVFSLLRKRWWIIGGLAAICGAAMFLFTSLTYVQEYAASATIFTNNGAYISQQIAGNSDNKVNASDLTASVSLVPTYLELLRSERLADEVATKVAWDNPKYSKVTYEDVKDIISFSDREDTTVIDVRSVSTDKELAKIVVAAYLEIAPGFLSEMLGADNVASMLDNPRVSTLSSGALSDGLKVALIVAVLVCAAIILISVLDQRIRSEEDFVTNYDVPILGIIPVFDIPSKKGVLGFEQKK